MPQYPLSMSPQLLTPSIENSAANQVPNLTQSTKLKQCKVTKIEPTSQCLEMQPESTRLEKSYVTTDVQSPVTGTMKRLIVKATHET